MPSLTLAIPEDLKREMDSMPEMNWSEVARKAIREKAKEYKLFKSIVAKSKLTPEDARQFADKINESMYKHYKAQYEQLKRESGN